MPIHRFILTATCLVSYLFAGIAAGLHLGHDHSAHIAVLSDGNPETAACACGHHHDAEKSPAEPHHHPNKHDDENCRLCQFLAQKPLPVVAALVEPNDEIIEIRSEAAISRPDAPAPALPCSRAPPAVV